MSGKEGEGYISVIGVGEGEIVRNLSDSLGLPGNKLVLKGIPNEGTNDYNPNYPFSTLVFHPDRATMKDWAGVTPDIDISKRNEPFKKGIAQRLSLAPTIYRIRLFPQNLYLIEELQDVITPGSELFGGRLLWWVRQIHLTEGMTPAEAEIVSTIHNIEGLK